MNQIRRALVVLVLFTLSIPVSKADHSGEWTLLSRSNGFEVWRDDQTGLVWSDWVAEPSARGHSTQFHYGTAERLCSGKALSTDLQDLSQAAKGRMLDLTWHLPTQDDYRTAVRHGLLEILPHFSVCDARGMGCDFWTSTFAGNDKSRVTFNGETGRFGYKSIWTYFSAVRCVSSTNERTVAQ